MELSLLLATRNNAGALGNLLTCLTLCQKPDVWEIIVVDNGGTDNTAEIVNNFIERLPLKYLYAGGKGKSRALNQGMKLTTGEIILFTDDDVIPDRYWLINHIHVMREHPHIKIVGGKITVNKTRLPMWISGSFNLTGILVSEHDLGDKELIYDSNKYPYGPNMAVRRSAVVNMDNPWPEDLGPGTSLPVGDEMVFTKKINKTGNDSLYSPDCIVEHKPNIQMNFFIKSVRRCFLGGYVAGYYSEPRMDSSSGKSFLRLAISRVTSSRSIREFYCILSRAAGFFSGRIHQQFY